jgi:hypothetical protein
VTPTADTKDSAGSKRGDADRSVHKHIESLVAEEHRLYGQDGLSEIDRKRLHAVQVELDQYWDLLRQRRARREFGENPGEAHVRPAKTVENYEG